MYNHIEVILMNASNLISAEANSQRNANIQIKTMHNLAEGSINTRAVSNIQFIGTKVKSTGVKSIDQLVLRHSICLSDDECQLASNAFQKSLVLYGQDQRLDFVNLPPCMYMLIADAAIETKFVIHRFYLPYKNGVRFATYLLNEQGDIIESVSYQRNSKYLQAFKVIRKQIAMASNSQQALAA
ncbi:MAG: hypothetical protein ACJAUM_001390 [Pseudomonadales bacterium]|jgi:hypothetical protein